MECVRSTCCTPLTFIEATTWCLIQRLGAALGKAAQSRIVTSDVASPAGTHQTAGRHGATVRAKCSTSVVLPQPPSPCSTCMRPSGCRQSRFSRASVDARNQIKLPGTSDIDWRKRCGSILVCLPDENAIGGRLGTPDPTRHQNMPRGLRRLNRRRDLCRRDAFSELAAYSRRPISEYDIRPIIEDEHTNTHNNIRQLLDFTTRCRVPDRSFRAAADRTAHPGMLWRSSGRRGSVSAGPWSCRRQHAGEWWSCGPAG
jgi:hypothetical protein